MVRESPFEDRGATSKTCAAIDPCRKSLICNDLGYQTQKGIAIVTAIVAERGPAFTKIVKAKKAYTFGAIATSGWSPITTVHGRTSNFNTNPLIT